MKAFASRSRSFKSILGGIAIVGASALVLSGCTPTTDEGTTPAGPREPLTLKIGTILPQSGTLAFLGPPEEAGVALAVQEINDALDVMARNGRIRLPAQRSNLVRGRLPENRRRHHQAKERGDNQMAYRLQRVHGECPPSTA